MRVCDQSVVGEGGYIQRREIMVPWLEKKIKRFFFLKIIIKNVLHISDFENNLSIKKKKNKVLEIKTHNFKTRNNSNEIKIILDEWFGCEINVRILMYHAYDSELQRIMLGFGIKQVLKESALKTYS